MGWLERYGFRRPHIRVFDHRTPALYTGLDIDALYIGGGNTFSQLARLRACWFDREVIRYVRQGVTYIGGCAGAHIATKNVEHVLPFDSNTAGITDFDALGLFNGILFCHYT